MNSDELRTQMMIEHLLLQNAIEISGIDEETNEMLYSITDRLKEVSPELYAGLKQDFERHMFEMIDQGPKVMQWRLSI